MDLLLTPLLNRVLRKFIRSSSEGAGSELRVSLSSRGTITLHNLELCLDSVLEGVGFLSVTRAFARQLQVTVPWTGLTTQPIQVVLDTVELVLGPGDLSTVTPQRIPSEQQVQQESDAGGGSSWLGGTLQTLALRAGLNISVKLNNVVVKYVETDAYAASLTLSSLHLRNSADGWRDKLENPEAWINKECTIRGLSLCLDQCRGPAGKLGVSFQPVLRAPSIRLAAQLPVFAFLEGAALLGDPFKTSVQVEAEPINVTVNDWQLQWAAMLMALLQEAAAAKAAAAEAAAASMTADAEGHPQSGSHSVGQGSGIAAAPWEKVTGMTRSGNGHSGREAAQGTHLSSEEAGAERVSPYKTARPATKALGVFGRVWDIVHDEAQHLDSARGDEAVGSQKERARSESDEDSDTSWATLAHPPMHAELDVAVKGLSVQLSVVERCGDAEAGQQQVAPQATSTDPSGHAATAAAAAAVAVGAPIAAHFHTVATPAEQEARFMEALQALSAQGGRSDAAAQQPVKCAARVHQVASLTVVQAEVFVSSVNTSFTNVEVRLGRCSLQRNTAAASLDPSLFAPDPQTSLFGAHSLLGEPSLTGEPSPTLKPAVQASPRRSQAETQSQPHSRTASSSFAGWEHQASSSAAGSPSTVQYCQPTWDEIFGLHPVSEGLLGGSAGTAAPASVGQQLSSQAVHLRWQNPGAVGNTVSPEAAKTAYKQQRAGEVAPQRCAAHVGHIVICWAPGFASNVRALLQPVLALGGEGSQEEAEGVSSGGQTGTLSPNGQQPVQAQGSEHTASNAAISGEVSSQGFEDGSSGPSALHAVVAGMVLEAHLGLLHVALLTSQEAGCSGVLLSLQLAELRSGPLNWEATWNSHLRDSLLAPKGGFPGSGLRASVNSLGLAMTGHWLPSDSRAGQLAFPGCQAVTNSGQLQAVLAFREPLEGCPGNAAASSAKVPAVSTAVAAASPEQAPEPATTAPPPPALLVTAALSPLSAKLSGCQVAAVAAAVKGLSRELSGGLLLRLAPPCGAIQPARLAASGDSTAGGSLGTAGAADSGSIGGSGWLGSIALELGAVQVVYSQAGGLAMQLDLQNGGLSLPSDLPVAARLLVECPSAAVRLEVSPAACTAKPGAVLGSDSSGAEAAGPSRQQQDAPVFQVEVGLKLVRPAVWAVPGWGISLPAAQLTLPSAPTATRAAPGSAVNAGKPARAEHSLAMLAGCRLASKPASSPGAQPQVQQQPLQQPSSDQLESTLEVHFGSVSVALEPDQFDQLVALLRAVSHHPALPPPSEELHTYPSTEHAVPAAGPAAGMAVAAKAEQEASPELTTQLPPPVGTKLSVSVEQLTVSVSVWEVPRNSSSSTGEQGKPRHQLGLAGWASGLLLQWSSPPSSAGAGSMYLAVGCLGALLTRQAWGADMPATSPVISYPAGPGGGKGPGALELSVAISQDHRSIPCSGSGSGGSQQWRQLSARSAPISLTITPELLSLVASIGNPIRQALQGPPASLPTALEAATAAAVGQDGVEEPASLPFAEAAVPLRGTVSLQRLCVSARAAAVWEQPGQAQQPLGSCDEPAAPPGAAAVGAAVSAGAASSSEAAAEVVLGEVAVLLHQAAASEGRPWLAGQQAGLVTTLEASLVGAELSVHHTGLPGITRTALLTPVDGRLQLLRHGHTGCLAVGLHAAALPVQVSLPAISAVAALVSALSAAAERLSFPGDGAASLAQDSGQGIAAVSGRAGYTDTTTGSSHNSLLGEELLSSASPVAHGAAARPHVYIEDAGQDLAAGMAHPGLPSSSRKGQQSHQVPGSPAQDYGSGSASVQQAQQQQGHGLDDLRGGMFTALVGEPGDPGPLQIKASTTVQRVGLSWSLSPQRQQQLEHCIHWSYPHNRPVTLLYIEGCSPALLGVEFGLCCYSVEAGAFFDVPIRAATLSALATPRASDPAPQAADNVLPLGGAGPESAAAVSSSSQLFSLGSASPRALKHHVAILVLTEVASRQWRLHWTSPATPGARPSSGGAAAPTRYGAHSTQVLRQLHINPPGWSRLAAPTHAEVCAELGLPLIPVPAPLAAPFTVALEAEVARVSLLAPAAVVLTPEAAAREASSSRDGAAAGLAEPAGDRAAEKQHYTWDALVHARLGRLQLAVHTWEQPSGLAVDAQALLGLDYLESTTKTTTTLVEPFQLDACFETRPPLACLPLQQPAQCVSPVSGASSPASATSLSHEAAPDPVLEDRAQAPLSLFLPQPFFHSHVPAHDLASLTARQPPKRCGKSVSLQANHTPMLVNVSELTIPELQRLVNSLSNSWSAISESPTAGSVSVVASAAQQTTAALGPPILLDNRCGVDLWVGQKGVPEHLLIPNGSAMPYLWAAPPGLVPGAVRKLQVAPALVHPAEASWSAPFEAMAQSACQVTLVLSPAFNTILAVSVTHEDHSWRVLLQPAVRLVNHLSRPIICSYKAALHIEAGMLQPPSPQQEQGSISAKPASGGGGSGSGGFLRRQLSRLASFQSQQLPEQHQHLPADGGATVVPLTRQRQQGLVGRTTEVWPSVRLWLGAADGWSSEVPLDQVAAGVQVLSAAPTGLTALHGPSPPAGPGLPQDQPSLGAVLCHLQPINPATGQAVLSFWPPITLHNRLPLPLTLCLPPSAPAGLEGSRPQVPARQRPTSLVGGPSRQGGGAEAGCLFQVVDEGGFSPLRVQYQGGELARLRLGPCLPAEQPQQQQQQQQQEGDAGDAAGALSVPICSPPMVGAAGEGSPGQSQGFLTLPQPGDYALLSVPYFPHTSSNSSGRSSSDAVAADSSSINGAGEGVRLLGNEFSSRMPRTSSSSDGAATAAPAAERRHLECVVLTEQRSEELPVLKLSIVPRGVVRNCLPVAILFQVPGCEAVTVPAHSSLPTDWQPLPMRPRDAKVSLQAYSLASLADSVPSGQQATQQQQRFDSHGLMASGGLVLLTSQRFPIDDTLDTHLMVKAQGPPRADSSRSLRKLLEGRQHHSPLECRLAAQVVVEKHAGGDIETVCISITPGCFVSNMTGLPLLLHPDGTASEASLCISLPHSSGRTDAAADSAGAVGTAGLPHGAADSLQDLELLGFASDQQLLLEDTATLPLLHVWGGMGEGQLAGASAAGGSSAGGAPTATAAGAAGESKARQGRGQLHKRARSWGGADLLRTFSASSGSLQHRSRPDATASKPALRFAILAAGPEEAGMARDLGAFSSPGPDQLTDRVIPGRTGSQHGAHNRGEEVPRAEAAGPEATRAGQPGLSTAASVPLEPAWSSRVDPFEAATRQRLYLQDPSDGQVVLLTYRILIVAGRLHLVLFRDRQPPFTIHNRTLAPLEVGYCPPQELPGGGFEYRQPRYALRVAPGQLVECDFNPAKGKASAGLAPSSPDGGSEATLSPRRASSGGGSGTGGVGGRGGWEDEEDEDAFLDCLLQEELRARGQAQERPPAVVKFRAPGTKDWLHPCVLLSGSHPTAADMCVEVSRACATTRIVIRPPGVAGGQPMQEAAASVGPTAAATAGGGEAAGQAASALNAVGAAGSPADAAGEKALGEAEPLRLAVHCRQLQLCLWDDDRRRLLPPPLPRTSLAAPGTPVAPAPVQPGTAAAAAAGGTAAAAGSAWAAGQRSSPWLVEPHPIPGHVVAQLPAAAKELLCFSVDGLRLGLSRGPWLPSVGTATLTTMATASSSAQLRSHPSLQQVEQLPSRQGAQHRHRKRQQQQQQSLVAYHCQLLARGLHCDSFLPGSEYPVVLMSLPLPQQYQQGPGTRGGGAGPLQGSADQMPLAVQTQIHYSPGPDRCPPSFRNTWVHQLSIRLPTLAVAVDDALLAFLDHAKSALGAPEGNSEQAQQGPTAGDSTCSHKHQEATLQAALRWEAVGAAASRLYIESAVVEPVQALADIHLSKGTASLPVAVDVHRAPMTLSRIAAHGALFRPHVLVRGLMAHGIAEALLNAPQMLGSLELLFNPTGLVQSVRQGVSDFVGLPMAALHARSPSQFLANVGRGSASLVMHLSGWTLSSISGFSSAFARAVDSAVAIRQQRRAHVQPANVGRGLVQGLTGLAEGVAAGLSAVVEAPIQGYSSGTGVLSGLGRGLIGAIGLPVSGALELVGAVSAGLASSAGITHHAAPRRAGRDAVSALQTAPEAGPSAGGAGVGPHGALEGMASLAAAEPATGASAPRAAGDGVSAALSASRLVGQALAALAAAGPGGQPSSWPYLAHCPVEAAAVTLGTKGVHSVHFAAESRLVHRPVLLLLEGLVILCSEGGLGVVLALPFECLQCQERYSLREVSLYSPDALLPAAAGEIQDSSRGATVRLKMEGFAWLTVIPLLRQQLHASLPSR